MDEPNRHGHGKARLGSLLPRWKPRETSKFSLDATSPPLSSVVILSHALPVTVSFADSPARVFSVFGEAQIVKAFSSKWTELVSEALEAPEPFYSAFFTYCPRETFRDVEDVRPPSSSGHTLRRAVTSDLSSIAQLCKEFADTSAPFTLTHEQATVEAEELISKAQVWLYEVRGEGTTICAVTRNSLHVSAITKVYTTPKWRRRGFGERLVRFVNIQSRVFDCGKEAVVLYVGRESSTQGVYKKIGFVRLHGAYKGVEDALEIGFLGTERGHW